MSNATVAYPFDPTGTRASNKITAEHLTIAPPELSEFLFLIPAAAPFFKDSMQVVHLPSQRTLVEGIDYVVSHYFHDASMACAKPIYGSLTFTDNRMTGAVRLSYQTLGGDWVLEAAKIIQILSNKLVNPRRVTWEQIADLPYAFPTIDHEWHLDDLVGMSEMVQVLEGIRDALIASGEGGLQTHIADKENPHQVTKAQVGLGNVENYPVATVAEAQAGTATNRYLTVLRGAQMIEALIGNTLNAHIGRSDNPHNVTKSQIGLGNVADYAVASQSEAEAGASNLRYMTPLRTAQAVQSMAVVPMQAHIARTDNPHNTTKAQVGLSNVQNYGIADVVAARAGLSNELYMTPAMTREAISMIALQGVTEHLDDRNNPHNVTKVQVGLGEVQNLPLATQQDAEEGTSNAHYLTVLRGRQLMDALVGGALQTHLNDSSNPHGTTKAQVGLGNVDNFNTATDEQALAGTARNLFMTPASTKAAVEAQTSALFDGHVDDLNNPHRVSKTQVGLGSVENYATATDGQATEGTARNLYMTPAGTRVAVQVLAASLVNAHAENDENPHRVTKAQVGLGNVSNYATATDEEAAVGTARNLFMTPASTVALINALGGAGGGSSAELLAHLNDLNNPHEVSKAQVGLGNVENYGIASSLEAQTGTATNLYMTPASTAAAIAAQVGQSLSTHLMAVNPHGTTAAQVGAFSQQETTALLEGKLDADGQAADSSKLDGRTYDEVVRNAQVVEHYPSVNAGFGVSWTLLGETTLPSNMFSNQLPDIIAAVTGGESSSFGIASTFTVHLCPRNLAFSRVVINNENYTRDVTFGYVREVVDGGDDILRLYLRGPLNRRAITVAPISNGDKFFVNTDVVIEQEPENITYLALSMPPFTRTRPTFGDVAFGNLPTTLNTEQTTGGLIEWVSVAHDDTEELVARAVKNSLEEDFGDFLPATPGGYNYLYDNHALLDKWGWNETEGGVLFDAPEIEGVATLTANEYMTDYTFEVEISSTDGGTMGAGVLAAVVENGGRPFAIAVVRTPGGLNGEQGYGGFEYKLNSVALHMGQADFVDLGSANGELRWMDTNAPNDVRDPATFEPEGAGWSDAGKVRIRVTRANNLLTVDVSQFGSTSYIPSEQLVLDFETLPALAAFKDRPSSWGLITVKQPFVTFKVLSRPRQYRDYVRLGVIGDNGKQRHYRFDGQVWQMSYLGIANPLVRPNRLYYSDWNGRLYHSQRNGRLREIQIEAFSRQNPTVLTT